MISNSKILKSLFNKHNLFQVILCASRKMIIGSKAYPHIKHVSPVYNYYLTIKQWDRDLFLLKILIDNI